MSQFVGGVVGGAPCYKSLILAVDIQNFTIVAREWENRHETKAESSEHEQTHFAVFPVGPVLSCRRNW